MVKKTSITKKLIKEAHEEIDWSISQLENGYRYYIIGYNPYTESALFLSEMNGYGRRFINCSFNDRFSTISLKRAKKELKNARRRKGCDHMICIRIVAIHTSNKVLDF